MSNKGLDVYLWARDEKLVDEIAKTGRNPRYVSDVRLPERLVVTARLDQAVRDAHVLLMAVPSHAMRTVAKEVAKYVSEGCAIVSLAKGLEELSLKRMTEVLAEELPMCAESVAALSGPNHAEEVSVGIPTATVVSALDRSVCGTLQEIFMTPRFRVYTNPDLVGVELAGATKNVIAIAAGISDGLGYGDNTKASLMTRGLAEMTRLGVAMGANERTFAGLSGVGDLIATCTSRHSRNRSVGERLGRGDSLDTITSEMRMVAEGIRSASSFHSLSRVINTVMPITEMVHAVIYEQKEIESCVTELMTRGATEEIAETSWA